MSNTVITGAPATARRTSVVSAAAILMASFVLSRLLGLVRVFVQNATLGATGHRATAFTTAFALPDLIFTLVTSGALASSFIPVFTGMLERGEEEAAWRAASGVLNRVLIVICTAVVVAEVFAPPIVGVIGRGPDYDLTLTLTRIMLLQPLFLTISGILMGLHNSYHRFVATAVAPLAYNVAIIAGLLFSGWMHGAVEIAAWSVTLGALLQVAVLVPGLSGYLHLIRPGHGLNEAGAREIWRLMLPRVVGQAGIRLSWVVTIAVANHEYLDRPTAALQTSFNLTALPIGIIGSAIATAVFPTFSSLAARGDDSALGAAFARTLRTMLFLAIPSAIGLIVLRYPITLLFEHGAFSAHDADVVAAGLVGWGVGIPVLVAVEILPRAFFALKDTWTPVRINLVTLAIAVILSIIGGKLTRGDSALGVCMLAGVVSLTVTMEVTWLCIELRRRLSNIGLRSLAYSALRSLVAGEAMAAALLALLYLWHRLGPTGQVGNLLLLMVALPLGVAVYTGWAYVVRAPELATAWAMVRARLHR